MVKKWLPILSFFLSLSFFMVSLVMGIVASEYGQFILGCLGAGVVFGFLSLWLWRAQISLIIRSHFFKNLMSTLLTIFLVGCIFGLINYLVYKNDLTADFTKNKIHTLSEQSQKAVNLISQDETLSMKLFAKRASWGRYHNLLKLYQASARGKLDLKYVDVEQEPALTELYNVKEEGTLVVEYKGIKFTTIANDELSVTNVLLKTLNPKKRILYYTVGHNEISFMDKNLLGADYLREKILSNNYELRPLELQNGIPDDCNAILIMNPQIEFLDTEIKNLRQYLQNGGGMLFTLSPQFNGLITQNLLKFIRELGLTFNNALVLDRLATQQGSQPSVPVIQNYNLDHPITKDLQDRTLFPVSGFFSFNESNQFAWDILVKSTPFPGSWGETDFEEVKSGKAVYNEDSDFKGPLNIMVAGSNEKSRVIGISSSQVVANQFQGQTPNFNLFLNALNWTVREEALISLDRPKLSGDLVYISDMQASIVFYFSVLFFPFIFFIVAIIRYRKKIRM